MRAIPIPGPRAHPPAAGPPRTRRRRTRWREGVDPPSPADPHRYRTGPWHPDPGRPRAPGATTRAQAPSAPDVRRPRDGPAPRGTGPRLLTLVVACLGALAVPAGILGSGLLPAGGPQATSPAARRQLAVEVPAPTTADAWIAYTAAGDSGPGAVYVVTPDGCEVRYVHQQVPDSPMREWSPDGGHLVFCTWPGYAPEAPVSPCREQASVAPYLRTPPSLTYLDSRPRRSPDGRRMAFVRLHDSEPHRAALIGLDVISGVDSVLVGFDADVGPGIDWSPDGSLIAYTASPAGDPTRDLWVVGTDGSQNRRITRLPAGWTASGPTFSPDGERIAVSLDSGPWTAIAIVAASGGEPDPVLGFSHLSPQELDWGPALKPLPSATVLPRVRAIPR